MPFNKSIYVFIISFLLGCTATNDKDLERVHPVEFVLKSTLDFDKQKGLLYQEGTPFTGTAISKYPTGVVATSVNYLNGLKQGLSRKWFPDGVLSFETTYAKGKQNGKSYTWWINGNLRTESNFKDGVPNGVQLQYYKSGSLFKKINLVAGKEEGLQQSWRENGKLYNNYEAKNGRIFGLKRSKLCFQLDNEEVQ